MKLASKKIFFEINSQVEHQYNARYLVCGQFIYNPGKGFVFGGRDLTMNSDRIWVYDFETKEIEVLKDRVGDTALIFDDPVNMTLILLQAQKVSI